jgi:hypothetical protein
MKRPHRRHRLAPEVEREYRNRMRSFDRLPPAICNKLNQGGENESI